MNSFDLTTYDCIGFDLDNTLAEYKEYELIQLIYRILANYMVNNYHYNPDDLLKPVVNDIDFIRKGLTIDIERGNILSLAEDGSVLRASHGTRILSSAEIVDIYGPEKTWRIGVQHCNDFLMTWNGELSERIRSSLDYFDISVPLLFARSIDSIKEKNNSTQKACEVWKHVFDSLYNMFNTKNYAENCGGYYNAVREDAGKYIRKRSPEFLNWVNSLKAANKITFLITGSDYDYGEFIAQSALGANWEKYFDVIVYFARKPGFFVQNREYKNVDPQESVVVPSERLQLGQSYREGNWRSLLQLFAKSLKKDDPKCVYIGDNLIQDIYAPAKYKCCDTIAVVKELDKFSQHDDRALFCSKTWGSILYDDVSDKPTVWGKVLSTYSKLNIPSLDWFVSNQ